MRRLFSIISSLIFLIYTSCQNGHPVRTLYLTPVAVLGQYGLAHIGPGQVVGKQLIYDTKERGQVPLFLVYSSFLVSSASSLNPVECLRISLFISLTSSIVWHLSVAVVISHAMNCISHIGPGQVVGKQLIYDFRDGIVDIPFRDPFVVVGSRRGDCEIEPLIPIPLRIDPVQSKGHDRQPEDEIKPVNETGEIVLSRVVVPEFIVVHNGTPRDTTAKDYYVRYKDYIKNVASSEIYATWPDNVCAGITKISGFSPVARGRSSTF